MGKDNDSDYEPEVDALATKYGDVTFVYFGEQKNKGLKLNDALPIVIKALRTHLVSMYLSYTMTREFNRIGFSNFLDEMYAEDKEHMLEAFDRDALKQMGA